MIFSILGLLLIIYSRVNFKESFLLYMLLEIIWFPQAKLIEIDGFPSIPISLVMSAYFVCTYIFRYKKANFNKAAFPLTLPFCLLVLSRFASCFTSLAGFGDEFSRSIGYLFSSILEVWIMWEIITEERDFNYLINGLFFIFLFAGIYGLFVFAVQENPIFDYKSSLIKDGINAYDSGDIRGYRLTSIFEHPLGAGMNFAIFIIFIMVAILRFNFKRIPRVILYITVLLSVVCIFYTKMRSGLFMLLVGVPAFVKLKSKQNIILVVVCLSLVFIVSTLLSDQIGIFESLFNKKAQDDVGGSNYEMRIEQLAASLYFLLQSPIAGLGEQSLLYLKGIQAFQLRALESVIFEEMVRHGILGLASSAVLMYYTTIKIPRFYKSKSLLFVSLAFWLTYISTSIPFFRMHLFYMTYFYIIFKIRQEKKVYVKKHLYKNEK